MGNIVNKYKKKFESNKDDMIADAKKHGESLGVKGGGHNGAQDAFRHAYISAKYTKENGSNIAKILGTLNEYKNDYDLKKLGKKGNPKGEWDMDEYNNAIGRAIGVKAEKEGWDDERIAKEVKDILDKGELITNPEQARESEESNNEYEKSFSGTPLSAILPQNEGPKMTPEEVNEKLGLGRKPYAEEQAESASKRRLEGAPQGIAEGEWDGMQRPFTPSNRSEKDAVSTGLRLAKALAAEAVPDRGNGYENAQRSHMEQAVQRTLLDLQTQADDQKERLINRYQELLPDINLRPGSNRVNDAAFGEIKTRVQQRFEQAATTGEDRGDIIKQEVQRGMNKLRFGEVNEKKKEEGFLSQTIGAVSDFTINYSDMRKANTIGADKYFHCKANYEAASRGIIGKKVAKGLSNARELVDVLRGGNKEASAADQTANVYGREQANKHKNGKSACSPYRPNGLKKGF